MAMPSYQKVFLALFVGGFAGLPVHATTKTKVADPVTVEIPALKIHAKVEARGTTGAGIMVPPKSAWNVAWHIHSVRPGDPGNAVMYGHLNTTSSTRGVFTTLHRLRPGNTIRVTDAKKVTRVFKVSKVGYYTRDQLPLRDISGKTKKIHLNVYTCAGYWNHRLGDYSHRFVVFSTLVSTSKVASQ